MSRNVVVVGYGMAGARVAEEIRRRDADGSRVKLTVLGAEPYPAYNRVLLSGVVAGTLHPESVWLHDAEWAKEHDVDLRLGTTVRRIDRAARRLELADGSGLDTVDSVGYDALVLATGAAPWLPPVEGLTTETGEPAPGVVAFRGLGDCERILDAAKVGAPVAVLGGGLLGLEAARGLAGRGNLVTVVHPVGHLMERQLDPDGGAVLAETLRGLGIEFRLGATAARYLPGDGLKLDDGSYVKADLVVVSAGVRAETALAAGAGLAVDRGVLVDDALRTSDGRIFAIGDCAQHPGTVSGLVQPAWEQAAVVADLVTGENTAARYRGTPVVTRLKARGVDLAAFGDTESTGGSGVAGVEVLSVSDPARGRYAKLLVREEKVAGAIVLGLPDAAANLTQLYDRGARLPQDRLPLLLGRALPGTEAVAVSTVSPANLPAAAVVCRCNSVTKGRLVEQWRAGATDLPALAAATRATTGCGGCADAVRGIASWLSETS